MVKTILLAALTHRDSKKLSRLIWSAQNQFPANIVVEGLVVCNSNDLDYVEEARRVAVDAGWMFRSTPSNGMPGRGKNSVLELFAQSSGYDYLFLMDGDDFLYPTAFDQIEQLTRVGSDVVGLLTNDVIDTRFFEGQSHLELFKDVYLYTWFDEQVRWPADLMLKEKLVLSNPLGEQTTPDRVVLFSKKAAATLRCSEQLPVYEDYVLSLRARAAMIRGEISYTQSGTTYVYVYDKTDEGSVCKQFDRKHKGDWSVHDSTFRGELLDDWVVLNSSSPCDVPFIMINHPSRFTTDGKTQFLRCVMTNMWCSINNTIGKL